MLPYSHFERTTTATTTPKDPFTFTFAHDNITTRNRSFPSFIKEHRLLFYNDDLIHYITFSFHPFLRYITQQSHKLTKQQVILPPEVTGVTPWRSGKELYRKNEVFLDVVEKINLLVSTISPHLALVFRG